MKYIIYNTDNSPSKEESNMIWSVLLIGDRVQITCTLSPVMLIVSEFKYYSADQKEATYNIFRQIFESSITWAVFEAELKLINKLRNKKMRTHIEQTDLKNKEKWLRTIDEEFLRHFTSNLALWHYNEIAPLLLKADDKPDSGISAVWQIDFLDPENESEGMEHLVSILARAISDKENMMVFDERMLPFVEQADIMNYPLSSVNEEKPVIYSRKLFSMPLCNSLKSFQIQMARNEMKEYFMPFHEEIKKVVIGAQEMQKGIENIQQLMPGIINKIEKSNFVQSARNQQELEYVDMHLGFTTIRGLITMIHKLNMLNEEQVLQAFDIIEKENKLEELRAFVYITRSAK